MARIYSPRQRQSDHRWDFTVGSDEEKWTHPTGYCAGFPEFTPQQRQDWHVTDEYIAKLAVHTSKYHKTGHATAKEASACWNEYRLDHDLILDGDTPDQQMKCAECGEWTTKYAQLRGEFSGRHMHLCDAHRTREVFVAHSKKTNHDLDE